MIRLDLKNLAKSFKATKILDDVSLSVEAGEIVAVLGPSGTGKTVLLRIVAGVEDPDGGNVIIDGEDMTDVAPDRRGVGMAFQNFALFPHLTTFDNIASPLSARRIPQDQVVQRVKSIAHMLKIDHVLGHAPRELSNGQKQRTALARALIGNPDVLLLDDPLRNVDAKLRYEMRLELPSLLRRGTAAALYVTQDYREAMAIADRIAVLVNGRFEQIATPEEIYTAPASVAVARLFGDPTINLAEIQPFEEHGALFAMLSGAKIRLGRSDGQPLDRPCCLGIRPEHLAISRLAGDDAVRARILAMTPLHEKAILLLK